MSQSKAVRLTEKQVAAQLRLAREAFRNRGWLAGSGWVSSDFGALGLVSHEEQTAAIRKILAEIAERDYCGPHPPNHLAGEPKCKDLRLLQFTWVSESFQFRMMYFKFCVSGQRLFVLRLHPAYGPNRFNG